MREPVGPTCGRTLFNKAHRTKSVRPQVGPTTARTVDATSFALRCTNASRDVSSFRAINTGSCLLGWDEYLGPACTGGRLGFNSSGLAGIGSDAFTRIDTVKSVAADIQSVELVIFCTLDGLAPVDFLVDDVVVQPRSRVFDDGFEELP